jgi:hypothetical protein
MYVCMYDSDNDDDNDDDHVYIVVKRRKRRKKGADHAKVRAPARHFHLECFHSFCGSC